MKIFVTGASGFIGSAVTAELIGAGHQVIGLVRSDKSAAAVAAAGAEVLRGDLDDLDSLRAGAAKSDGVIHLAFNHDFSQFEASARSELRAIETIGEALVGSGKPFVIASGVIGLAPGRLATEKDSDPRLSPRAAGWLAALALADRGVRPSIVRLAPSVHDQTKGGFASILVDIARQQGVAAYVGNGANHWPAVHVLDAAHLFCLALEKAPAGSILHGVGEEGVSLRDIAEVIGRHLGVPVVSITAEDAPKQFGWMAPFLSIDTTASNTLTRELLGWQPTHPGLLTDLDHGHFFDS